MTFTPVHWTGRDAHTKHYDIKQTESWAWLKYKYIMYVSSGAAQLQTEHAVPDKFVARSIRYLLVIHKSHCCNVTLPSYQALQLRHACTNDLGAGCASALYDCDFNALLRFSHKCCT